MPAMLELRIRACHVRGSFVMQGQRRAARLDPRSCWTSRPASTTCASRTRPSPSATRSSRASERMPAARATSPSTSSTSCRRQTHPDVGLDRAGRPLQRADARPAAARPGRRLRRKRACRSWCSTSPTRWCPSEIAGFCRGKRAVLVVEEGQPEYIEQDIRHACIVAATSQRRCTARTCCRWPASTPSRWRLRDSSPLRSSTCRRSISARRATGSPATRSGAPRSPPASTAPCRRGRPGFCIGCPERPVFAALKLAQQEVGPVHVAADIGCHALATFEPFSLGSFDPRLRHEPGQQRRRRADDEAAGALGHGRRRLLAQRPAHRRAVLALQRRRFGAADHEERLHLGHRHAGHHLDARRGREGARTRQAAEPGRPQHHDRVDAEGPGRAVAAHRAHLSSSPR